MDAVHGIINTNVSSVLKSKMLVNVVRERSDILTTTIELLTKCSDTQLLTLFITEYESPQSKRRRFINANSASDWSSEELDYFMINFQDIADFSNMCDSYTITPRANAFICSNRALTRSTVAEGLKERSAVIADTEFKRDALFVANIPSNESSVDDMIKTFLSEILSDRFLVKTRYDIQLIISSQKRKATADVIVFLFPQLYVGVIVVEDKPNDKSRSESQWDNAEAQAVAEAIAVMQQRSWPHGLPVFALRVLETFVTIYRLDYNANLLSDVKGGNRSSVPCVIKRFMPDSIVIGQRPGWDLLDPPSREILVNAISSMSQYMEATHAIKQDTI
jgi:hypothetical protein